MAAHVFENQNHKSSLHINNQVSNKYRINIFDRAKLLIAMVSTHFFKGLVYCTRIRLKKKLIIPKNNGSVMGY